MDFDSMESDDQTFGTPGQTLATGLEGAAQGILGPAAPWLEKHVLHIPTTHIQARAEANPIAKGAGEITGLLGGALTGTGLGGLMGKAGEAAEAASNIGNASYLAKVGSEAVKQAAEMAVLQGSDETAKMVMHDPNTSTESAIANIGLAAALGGTAGATMAGVVSPLWKATVGDKANQVLGSLISHIGGQERGSAVAAGLAQKAGLEIPEELAAKINDAPGAVEAFSSLSQNDTTHFGKKLQKSLANFQENLGNSVAETLGHDSDYLKKVPDLDKFATGQKIADNLHNDIKEIVQPISDKYEAINEQLKNSPFSVTNRAAATDEITQKALQQGWHKAESYSQMNLVDNVLKKLSAQETAEDLKKFMTNLTNSHPFGSDTYQAAKEIKNTLRDAQERAITEGILSKGGDSVAAQAKIADYQSLKGQYRDMMGALDNLNEHLHVGKYEGPQSFLNALKEMGSSNPEAVINRLSGANRAQALELLGKISPKTLQDVRQFHVDKLLNSSVENGELKVGKFANKFDKLSPQVKELIADQSQQERLSAIQEIHDRLGDPNHNWSNTARTAAKLAGDAASPLTMLATLMGHGAEAFGARIAALGYNEARAAVKMGMLKFLGSDQPVKSEALKATINLFHNALKGESSLVNGAAAVFKRGTQVLTAKEMPAKAEREKLDKVVTRFQNNPQEILHLSNNTLGHYTPEHSQAFTQNLTSQAQYLAGLKPRPKVMGPLDKPIPLSPASEARYHRAMDIAEKPQIIMQHIKDGTLQSTDLVDLKNLYPNLYNSMSQKLSAEMTKAHARGEEIPYKTRNSLSLFLGQSLDSTTTPISIQMAQPIPPQPANAQGKPKKPSQKSGSEMEKGAKSHMTQSQAAESDRGDRH
jgi:hypothetical protein